uniref:DUF7793 family protein n=1 Tax=Arthrobacter pityocampae TaxID=547334 RepID=UPI003735751A
MAVEVAMALRQLSEGRILPLLVIMRGIDGVTLQARLGMNAYRGFSVVALVGDGPVDEVMAGFSHRSLVPTRYFTEEDSARLWVESVLQSSDDGSLA